MLYAAVVATALRKIKDPRVLKEVATAYNSWVSEYCSHAPGWVPYWLEQIDDRYARHRHWAGVNLKRKPSEYIRSHIYFAFQEDHAGVALRQRIGIDNICWASDFPHAVGDWPYSRETRERQFKDVPGPERRKIEALNLACLLGLITAAEKEAQSLEPLSGQVRPLKVAGRGERRA